MELDVRELVLVHRALEALKHSGLVPHQDVLLNDTLQLVDVTLREAV